MSYKNYPHIKKFLLKLKNALASEGVETKEMLLIYQKQLHGKATIEEKQRANQQFKDILKSIASGVIFMLPFGMITLPLAIKLGHKLNIDILPSSFKHLTDKDD